MVKYMYQFRYIVVGDAGVGKSSLLRRFELDKFDNNQQPTTNIEYVRRSVIVDDQCIMVQIWDTQGQEKFFSIANSYYKNCCAAIVVYDITDRNSFKNCKDWINRIKERSNKDVKIILVGNKQDLIPERQVKEDTALSFAQQHKIPFIETSAKINKQVDKLFYTLTYTVLQEIRDNKLTVDSSGTHGVRFGNQEESMKELQRQKKKCCS